MRNGSGERKEPAPDKEREKCLDTKKKERDFTYTHMKEWHAAGFEITWTLDNFIKSYS